LFSGQENDNTVGNGLRDDDIIDDNDVDIEDQDPEYMEDIDGIMQY
jgi:hypothetical protein